MPIRVPMDDEMNTSRAYRRHAPLLNVRETINPQEVFVMQVTLIAIDLAKSIFQVCGVNQAGKQVFNRSVRRSKLLASLAQFPGATIAMEACSGSNYWGRTFQKLGHEVLLIPPQHVKPFVKGNKNDRNDAFAISEAARRPGLITVKPRTLEDTEVLALHRVRERLISERVALLNQMRGLLNEYGIIAGLGKCQLIEVVRESIDSYENDLSSVAKLLFSDLLEEHGDIQKRIDQLDQRIAQAAKAPDTKRLMTIRGIGEKGATALKAHMGSSKNYSNGRHFAASLGLVPKEHSSGGKQALGGITKRGNRYIRSLLVQGAWNVLRYADKHDDRFAKWALALAERRGKHKAVVAIANKLARIAWAVIHHQTEYKAA